MNDELLELSILAYQAYGDSAEWKNYQDKPMPTWEELPKAIQDHWRSAVIRVRSVVLAKAMEEQS